MSLYSPFRKINLKFKNEFTYHITCLINVVLYFHWIKTQNPFQGLPCNAVSSLLTSLFLILLFPLYESLPPSGFCVYSRVCVWWRVGSWWGPCSYLDLSSRCPENLPELPVHKVNPISLYLIQSFLHSTCYALQLACFFYMAISFRH